MMEAINIAEPANARTTVKISLNPNDGTKKSPAVTPYMAHPPK